MNGDAPRGRDGERGFTLLEALVGAALSSVAVLGVTAAVLASLHATSAVVNRGALADDALNVLADVRVATAYDARALAALVGRTSRSTIVRDGKRLVVDLSVTQAVPHAAIVAHVTVTDETGAQAREEQELYGEAPAPGSVVDQSAASPAPGR